MSAKRLLTAAVLATGLSVCASPLAAQERERTSRVADVPDTVGMIMAARVTANYALLLLDQDRFDEAWPLFTDVYRRGRDGVPSLAAEIGEMRMTFGTARGRELVSEEYTTELPQALPGVYVVLVFNSTTGTGANVDEEVLMVPSRDLAWAVSSYRVRENVARELPVEVREMPEPGARPARILDPLDAARMVSDSVLMLLDRGLYDDAWPLFTDVFRRGRDNVSGLSYEIGEMRSRFGDISRRTPTTEEHGTDLPMALPGEYVLFGFDSTTRSGTRVQEEVLLSPMGGGAWGVSSYTVRAAQPARRNTKN